MSGAFNFGYIPRLANLTRRSWSIWIWPDAAPVSVSDAIIGMFDDSSGELISLTTDLQIQSYSKRHATLGIWKTPVSSVPTAQWVKITVKRDVTLVTNPPVIVINNVVQTLTEVETPAGALKSDVGTSLVIGNMKTATIDYTRPFHGKLFDPRVYSVILSADDETSLYNGGVPDYSVDPKSYDSGLIFQGFAVRTDQLSQYLTGAPLDNDLKVRSAVYGEVGEVIGEVTAIAPP